MNDYKEYFKQHDEIRNRVIEICQLFHRYDPRLYHDIAMDHLYFFMITIITSALLVIALFILNFIVCFILITLRCQMILLVMKLPSARKIEMTTITDVLTK